MANLFGAPMQNPVLAQQAQDPRQLLAQSLIAGGANARPVNSPVEGIARLASALGGALIARNVGKEYKQRSEGYNQTLAQALQASQPWRAPDDITNEAGTEVVVPRGQNAPGTGGMDAMVAALRGNPDTAPMAFQMQFDQFGRQQKMDDEKSLIGYRLGEEAKNRPGVVLGEGSMLVNPATGAQIAQGAPKTREAKTIETAEGVFILNPDGSKGARLGASPRTIEKGNQSGPFQGNAMDAQVANILLTGNPASPEYMAAFNIAAAPRVNFDAASGQMVTVRPDMSAYRPPARGGVPTAEATPVPGAAAPPNLAGGVSVEQVQEPRQPFNEVQGRAAGFADRMAESASVLDKTDTQGANWMGRQLEGLGYVGNKLQSPEYQQFEQARRDFINAQLRRESGAVISPEEFANAEKQYFPQPGDKPGVIEQKRQNRKTALESMRRDAGRNYTVPQTATPLSGPPKPPDGFELER